VGFRWIGFPFVAHGLLQIFAGLLLISFVSLLLFVDFCRVGIDFS